MLRKLISVATIVTMVVLSAPTADAKQHAMTGAWSGTDFYDQSALHVSIGGGNNHVVYQDDGATVCLTVFGEFSKASAHAFGEITGDHFEATVDINCHLSGGLTLWMADLVLAFDYNAGSDTLTDSSGQCYHRPSSPGDCP